MLFVVESVAPAGATLHKFEWKTRKTDKIAEGMSAVEISSNGEKLLGRQGQRWFIVSALAL